MAMDAKPRDQSVPGEEILLRRKTECINGGGDEPAFGVHVDESGREEDAGAPAMDVTVESSAMADDSGLGASAEGCDNGGVIWF